VNQLPAFFYKPGNKYGDDFIIETTFPGGHRAVIEEVFRAKLRHEQFRKHYDNVSLDYEEIHRFQPYRSVWQEVVKKHNFEGQTLDLGCGTGTIGRIILGTYPNSVLTGVDASPQIAEVAKKFYASVHVGLMQNVVMEINDSSYDNVVVCGAIHHLDDSCFLRVMLRSLQIAKQSVTVTVEDVPPEYLEAFIKANSLKVMYNHAIAAEQFASSLEPPWTLVEKIRAVLWDTPAYRIVVSGTIYRFERFKVTKNP